MGLFTSSALAEIFVPPPAIRWWEAGEKEQGPRGLGWEELLWCRISCLLQKSYWGETVLSWEQHRETLAFLVGK